MKSFSPVLLLKRLICAAALAGLALMPHASAQIMETTQQPKPEIWFGPKGSMITTDTKGNKITTWDAYGFSSMVQSTQGWAQASKNMAVLALPVTQLQENYPNIPPVINMLKTHDYTIAAGVTAVNVGTTVANGGAACSVTPTEGISVDNRWDFEPESYFTIHNWKQLAGGNISYLEMDGPFFFAYYAIASTCGYTPEQVAARAAITINLLLKDYPNAEIVDDEGPGPIALPQFFSDFKRFIAAFNTYSHKPISRVTMDMHYADAWHTGYQWIPATQSFTAFLHQNNIKAGLFMDAEDQYVESADGTYISTKPITNQGWMQEAREHLKLAMQNKIPFDYVYVASWMKYPTYDIPETNSASMASLVNDAFKLLYPACAMNGKTYATCSAARKLH